MVVRLLRQGEFILFGNQPRKIDKIDYVGQEVGLHIGSTYVRVHRDTEFTLWECA